MRRYLDDATMRLTARHNVLTAGQADEAYRIGDWRRIGASNAWRVWLQDNRAVIRAARRWRRSLA